MTTETPTTTENIKEEKVQHGGKFLSFFLKDEEYGIEILKVQEIIGMQPITRVPGTSGNIRGVINLRGKIIPVSDLRTRFGMEECDDSSETCTIVVQTAGIEIGVIVDRVSEVIDIPNEEIEDVPTFGGDFGTDLLLGIGNTDGHVRLLIDIDSILTNVESEQLKNLAYATDAEPVPV